MWRSIFELENIFLPHNNASIATYAILTLKTFDIWFHFYTIKDTIPILISYPISKTDYFSSEFNQTWYTFVWKVSRGCENNTYSCVQNYPLMILTWVDFKHFYCSTHIFNQAFIVLLSPNVKDQMLFAFIIPHEDAKRKED